MHIDYIRGILFIYLIYFERNMIFLVIFLLFADFYVSYAWYLKQLFVDSD